MTSRTLAFPVYAASAEEARLLVWVWREKAVLEDVRALAARFHAAVELYTDEPVVEAYCKDQGFTCHIMPFERADDRVPSFCGLVPTMERLRSGRRIGETEVFLFLNWRNISGVASLAGELDDALRRTDRMGLVGVVEAEDHPVQLLRTLECLALEFLVLVDDAGPDFLGHACTRPFSFDVVGMLTEDCEDGQALELCGLDGGGLFRPLRASSEARITMAEQGRLYLRAGLSSLRRVVPSRLPRSGYIPAFGDPALNAVLLSSTPLGWDLRLRPELERYRPELRVLGLRSGETAEELPGGIATSSGMNVSESTEHAEGFVRILASAGYDALAVTVGRSVDGANVDWVRPLEIENGYWRIDDASGAFVNARSDVPIYGRQDFPSLFKLDTSFLAASGERLEDLCKLLRGDAPVDTNFRALLFPKRHSLWHAQRVAQLRFMAEAAVLGDE